MKNAVRCLAAVMLVLLLCTGAMAAEEGAIKLASRSEVDVVTVNAKGKKEVKRVDAAKAKVVPGDTVIFINSYENVGKKTVKNAVITNPVPEHTVYVDGSAEGKGVSVAFSVDGGKSYGTAKSLMVVGKDGKARPALGADYTHIRWTLQKSLAPGAKGSVSFNAKIK